MSSDFVPEPVPRTAMHRRAPVVLGQKKEHPAPAVSARKAEPHEIPTGARRLIKKAESLGWIATPTYACGTSIDRHGAPSKLLHSLAVRLWAPDVTKRAVAVWTAPCQDAADDAPATGWKADCCFTWGTGELPLPTSSKALSAYIEEHGH